MTRILHGQKIVFFFFMLFCMALLGLNTAQAQSTDFNLPQVYKDILATAKNGDLKAAEKSLKQLKKDQGESADYFFVKGALAPFKLEKASVVRMPFIVKGMRKDWEKAVELNPNHEPANFSLALFYASAPSMFSGDPEKARAILQKFQENDSPLQYPLETNLLMVTEADAEEIKVSFQNWIQSEPNQVAPRLNFAVYLIEAEDYELAGDILTSIDPFSIDPQSDNALLAKPQENVLIHYQWGKLAAESGLFLIQGRRHLEWLIEINEAPEGSNMGFVHIRLAKVLHHLGEHKLAQFQRELAVPYKPKNRPLFELMDDFDAISAESTRNNN